VQTKGRDALLQAAPPTALRLNLWTFSFEEMEQLTTQRTQQKRQAASSNAGEPEPDKKKPKVTRQAGRPLATPTPATPTPAKQAEAPTKRQAKARPSADAAPLPAPPPAVAALAPEAVAPVSVLVSCRGCGLVRMDTEGRRWVHDHRRKPGGKNKQFVCDRALAGLERVPRPPFTSPLKTRVPPWVI